MALENILKKSKNLLVKGVLLTGETYFKETALLGALSSLGAKTSLEGYVIPEQILTGLYKPLKIGAKTVYFLAKNEGVRDVLKDLSYGIIDYAYYMKNNLINHPYESSIAFLSTYAAYKGISKLLNIERRKDKIK